MRFLVINVSLEIKSKYNEFTTSFRIRYPTMVDDFILRDTKDLHISFASIAPGYS
jgi:hypothetical protein